MDVMVKFNMELIEHANKICQLWLETMMPKLEIVKQKM